MGPFEVGFGRSLVTGNRTTNFVNILIIDLKAFTGFFVVLTLRLECAFHNLTVTSKKSQLEIEIYFLSTEHLVQILQSLIMEFLRA